MGFIDRVKKVFGKGETPAPSVEKSETPQPQATIIPGPTIGYGGYNYILPVRFDGEKDLGAMGPIRKYTVDHSALRMRSWQMFMDSDVCQALFERSAMWGIGNGLKLQAQPNREVLDMEGVDLDYEEFNEQVEALFQLYASTEMCDFSGNRTLSQIANEAWINMDVAGDVLIICRLVDNMPKVQVIDGQYVVTPLMWGQSIGNDSINPDNKHRVRNGVEIDDKGNHVAYWVYKGFDNNSITSYERIPAQMTTYPYSVMAKLVVGRKYRMDDPRGIPLITAVMETAAKMARYREAMVAGAESRAKIAFSIEHEVYSTGENPLQAQLSQASGYGPQSDIPTDSMGNALANQVSATTENMAFNMPNGAHLKMHDSKQEEGFTEFYTTNFDIVCAVAGYPPEVIMSKYNSNYSASRAAIKDFEHTLKVKRNKFASQLYAIVYNFCLDVWVLSGRIELPGYLQALAQRNDMVLNAYRAARWIGDPIAHIDPYKEVQAIRAMLPEDAANMPLITLEGAVETLGNGDFDDVLEQYERELKAAKAKGIEPTQPKAPLPVQPNGNPGKRKDTESVTAENKYTYNEIL